MYANESVPVRIKKSSLPALHRLKAELILEEGRKVSDAETISQALEFTLQNAPVNKKKRYNLLDLAGIIKGGPRTDSSIDADEQIYGDADAND